MTEPNVPGLTEPKSRLDKALQAVPVALSSKGHIIFLICLLVYLFVLPILHVYTPSSQDMLIGGNWTNVTSALGGSIAAGGTVHLVKQARKRNKVAEATHQIMADLYKSGHGEHHPAAIAEIVNKQE